MVGYGYFIQSGDYTNIPIYIFQILMGVELIFITISCAVWLFYYLSRINKLRKRVNGLKNQSQEYDHFKNARVKYIKSILMSIILFVELLIFALLIFIITSLRHLLEQKQRNNCDTSAIIRLSHNLTFRYVTTLALVLFTVYLSLIHIVTSYLSTAYSGPRNTKLSKRELGMFIFACFLALVFFASSFSPESFLVSVFFLPPIVFVTHIFLFARYSRSLYLVLERRRLDAWFDDMSSYRKLERMCKEYKITAILYLTSIVILSFSYVYIVVIDFVFTALKQPCFLSNAFHFSSKGLEEFDSNHGQTIHTLYRIFYSFLINIFGFVGISFLFSLHVSILVQAIRRLVRFRKDMNSVSQSSSLRQPLVK